MDANYFVHEGLCKSFGDGDGAYVSQIQGAFDKGKSFTKTIPSYVYYIENGNIGGIFSYPSTVREILKAGLPKQKYTLDGTTVKVKISISKDMKLTAKISGWKIDETGTLTIPSGVLSIPAQSFYRHGATTLILPKGCGTIESKAFANSAVRTVVIPGPVTSIADDAFEGCTDIMFITNDEKMKTFAKKHGFMVAAP